AIAVDDEFIPDLILAVGKAASGMASGALEHYPDCETLVVTKYEHAEQTLQTKDNVEVIEAAHPVPDAHSIYAGQKLLQRVTETREDSHLLLLVSGGASALAEALPDDLSLDDLQQETDAMLAAGKTIGEINHRRKQMSLIKDGKLLDAFCGSAIRVYAISDVEGDSISTIGSGLGDCHRARNRASSTIIASNRIARDAAAKKATALGLEVKLNSETLYDDVYALAPVIGKYLQQASSGVYIWGGEPTVILPEKPGRGGRNQSLALAISEYLTDSPNIRVLVAGTDGTDGPTEAAGGLIDADSWGDPAAAAAALLAADAGTYLEHQSSLFVTGPTNTNVMDLIIAMVE
ncbi:MAG: DUF4147 domain-containing protein, partial [Pseudomonadota bacterium]